MPATNQNARLNFRLNSALKKTIEEAAAHTGQSVSDFAISTLVQESRRILQESREEEVTRLSARDRELFARLIDDTTRKPNAALIKAAERHRKQVRS